ncbi:unnamed protein product [Periconia digitata]|uniref:Uncharacterized protein n=1 Tax=Periconia digitata TaxID=1303443 RepID=A0A9W4UK11_9PLEO|nr:unnamed protein product [Periconia digitata]
MATSHSPHKPTPTPTPTQKPSDPLPPSSSCFSIHSTHDTTKLDAEPRGRLKRRRRMSSHSPPAPRATSPSRGHDRDSGSRHRHHHRKHHRADSSSSATPPPGLVGGVNRRRRSDAEPDHTLRGRVRNRSRSRSGRVISEEDGDSDGGGGEDGTYESEERGVRERRRRRRDVPPSRARVLGEDGQAVDREMRRQRSLRNMYEYSKHGKAARKDSFGMDVQSGGLDQDENRRPSF